eukprot:scaffold1323_cov255-Pinguiococcus_pyrenoidosus.AAC.6
MQLRPRASRQDAVVAPHANVDDVPLAFEDASSSQTAPGLVLQRREVDAYLRVHVLVFVDGEGHVRGAAQRTAQGDHLLGIVADPSGVSVRREQLQRVAGQVRQAEHLVRDALQLDVLDLQAHSRKLEEHEVSRDVAAEQARSLQLRHALHDADEGLVHVFAGERQHHLHHGPAISSRNR